MNTYQELKNAREYIDNLMTNILATKRASSPSHQAHEDLLDRLLAPSTDATTPKFTDAEILGETTRNNCNTLTFVALELSRNPSVQESLKKEIKHLLTVYPTLTQETLHHFTYLDQVLRETQRLHPIVGIALRTSTAEVEHDGYIFPAGTKVGLHLMAMHRDSRVFGKDATTWKPDRWSSPDAPHVNSVIAFGEGIHNCIGQKVALIEVKIILIQLLRRFTIHLVEDQKIEFVTKGLKVRLVEDA
ncbi:cytochrome P450 [Rhizoclosmatium globosum]|uniref:Cytochrome P450 n=1 Tax=Rhizoclosmatium globosum TaxID=329046 RepID=A0A1Y2CW89_9FUNG|nr:cytochrome P450 [Rhizoclosmatium globosum]|eukprot:ORY51247.1 cytochrome P450 [Rhizoclosmatium globosum]